MSDAEPRAKRLSTRIGFTATPIALLRGRGSGARSPRRVLAATLGAIALAAALTAAPALAREIYLEGVNGAPSVYNTASNPLGMAIDQANGVMYVDAGGTVQKFSETGKPADFSGLGSTQLSVGGNFENIAVDNSTEASDPNKGDLYISNFGNNQIERFNEAGEPVGTAIPAPFQPRGMAVDSQGDLYVASYNGEGKVYGFSLSGAPLNSGNPVLVFPAPNVAQPDPYALAFNSAGDLYVTEYGYSSVSENDEALIEEFAPEAAGAFNPTPIGTPIHGGLYDRAIAVNQQTNQVFVDEFFGSEGNYSSIKEYNEQGDEIETFRHHNLSDEGEALISFGLAVNEAHSTVYVTDLLYNRVDIYHAYHNGTVTVSVSGSGGVTTETKGVTPPGAEPIKYCEEGENCEGEFQEGSTLTLTARPVERDELAYWEGCTRESGTTCEIEIGSGVSPVKAVFRLQQNTLTVNETGTGSGAVRCGAGSCAAAYSSGAYLTLNPIPAPHSVFAGWSGACTNASGPCLIEHLTEDSEVTASFDQIPPAVGFPGTSEIEQSTATLSAQVDPEGAPTTCRFEYGTTTVYGSQVPCTADPGSGASEVQVTAALTHLAPSTTYFFRVVASNVGGTTQGEGQVFTTLFPETCATNVALCVKPSNKFTIGVAKQHGASVILPVTVPGAGSVTVAGTDIEPDNDSTIAAATPLLKLKLTKSAKQALRRAKGHKLKAKVDVTFTPTGGTSARASTTVTFRVHVG